MGLPRYGKTFGESKREMPKLNRPLKKVKKVPKEGPNADLVSEAIRVSRELDDIRASLHEVASRLAAVSTDFMMLAEKDDIPF